MIVQPELPVFRCHQCRGLGVWIDPQGHIQPCPRVEVGEYHSPAGKAEAFIIRALDRFKRAGRQVDLVEFAVAVALLGHTGAEPSDRRLLIDRYFSWSKDSLRKFHGVIARLRYTWLLPVASRKESPAGYWYAATEEEFAEWFKSARSAPVTTLSGLHRLAKATYPVFAEQAELEFFKDMQPQEVGHAAS